nr:histone lysine N methyltransferase SETMAR [Hymenolepis microstoma]
MFPTFKVVSGDFAVEGRHSSGGEKVVEGAELEAILSEDSFHIQEKLSKSFGINQQAILKLNLTNRSVFSSCVDASVMEIIQNAIKLLQ